MLYAGEERSITGMNASRFGLSFDPPKNCASVSAIQPRVLPYPHSSSFIESLSLSLSLSLV
jgi:hypothetical protein